MRNDFCVLILTYGRPDNVVTYKTLKASGYTGKVYLVTDDSDASLPRYRENFGDQVLVFSKEEIAQEYDQGDNFADRRSVVYARNAAFRLAREAGFRYYIALDDDYNNFSYRLFAKKPGETVPTYHSWTIRNLNRVFEAMVKFVETTPAVTLAMSQGGDHIGGASGNTDVRLTRKAMNSFVCDVERPFPFRGRINEDTTAYVSLGNLGLLFFTYWTLQLNQKMTQTNPGGLTEAYLDFGTYVKSFYSVMYSPSCVKVVQSDSMRRPHHAIKWDDAVPKIIHERHRHNGER